MAKCPKLVSAVLIVVCLLLTTTTVFAQSAELVKYSAKESKILIGLNMSALRGSPAFREVLAFAKQDARIGQAIEVLESQAGLDIEKDVDAVVFAMPDPGAGPTASQNDTLVVILRGRFQPKRLFNAVEQRKEFKLVEEKGKVARYVAPSASVGFADDKHLVFTFGDSKYAESTWKSVNGGRSAAKDKLVGQLMSQINTKRGVWVIGITETLPQKGPKMKSAGLTIDVRKGLKVDMVGNMANKDDAKAALKDFDKLKSESANPMVGMLGAAPLVKNLKVSSEKSVVRMTTKMSAKEFGIFRQNIRNILAQGSQPATTTPSSEGPAPVKKGAAADFN